MNRSIVVLLVAVVAAVVAIGCTTVRMDSRVTMGPNLDPSDVPISQVKCFRQDNGYYVFQVNVLNNTSKELHLEWKVQWLDADGVEVESIVSTWQKIALAAHEIRGLKNTAANPNAVDARIYFRKIN